MAGSEPSFNLSQASSRLVGLSMYDMMDRACELEQQGKSIIHFEIGEPEFDTPPNVVEAAVASLHRGETKYCDSFGLPELRQAIARATQRDYGYLPDFDQILVTPGGILIIYLLVRAVADPGDEIIVPDPGFVTYESVISFCGCKAVRVPLREERGFRIDPAEVAAAITPKTKLIILDSPSNPTGAALDRATADELARIALERGIYLLSDEVYAKMTYGVAPSSPTTVDACRRRCLMLNGFSKTYSMTGWRLGYGIGPAPVVERMGTLLQVLIGSMPPFVQQAGIAALDGDQAVVAERAAILKTKRDALVAGLNSLPGVSCLAPDGAFYAFPNITGTGMTSEQFCERMLEEVGVACLPGSSFGPHGQGYVRFCYSLPLEQIEDALDRMRRVLAQPKP